jgi:hypothetical protein
LAFVHFLLLLGLIEMPLDGEENASAQHDQLEGNEDDRYPIHGKGQVMASGAVICQMQAGGKTSATAMQETFCSGPFYLKAIPIH